MQWQADGELDPSDLIALVQRLQAVETPSRGDELARLGEGESTD